MDGRTGLVIGGVSTLAASIAVVCAVALSNSVALADSAGASVSAPRVLVPAATVAALPAPPEDALPIEPVAPGQAEVVEAAAPVVVETAPVPPAPAPAEPAAADGDDALETAASAGAWEDVRERAEARGWTPERIDEWIARYEGGRRGEADDDWTDEGEQGRDLQQRDRDPGPGQGEQRGKAPAGEGYPPDGRGPDENASSGRGQGASGDGSPTDGSHEPPGRRDR